MSFILHPWQLFFLILSGLVNRKQQEIIDAGDEVGRDAGDVRCRERLGGMLRYYHREAA